MIGKRHFFISAVLLFCVGIMLQLHGTINAFMQQVTIMVTWLPITLVVLNAWYGCWKGDISADVVSVVDDDTSPATPWSTASYVATQTQSPDAI